MVSFFLPITFPSVRLLLKLRLSHCCEVDQCFFTVVDNSTVVLQFSLLLFKPTKQRSSKKHPSGLMPEAGVQRLASWLGNTWSRSLFVPLPWETLPEQQWHRGWQKPIYQLRAATRAGAEEVLGAEYQYPRAPNAVLQLQ